MGNSVTWEQFSSGSSQTWASPHGHCSDLSNPPHCSADELVLYVVTLLRVSEIDAEGFTLELIASWTAPCVSAWDAEGRAECQCFTSWERGQACCSIPLKVILLVHVPRRGLSALLVFPPNKKMGVRRMDGQQESGRGDSQDWERRLSDRLSQASLINPLSIWRFDSVGGTELDCSLSWDNSAPCRSIVHAANVSVTVMLVLLMRSHEVFFFFFNEYLPS